MLIRIYAIFVLLKVLGANLQQLVNASVEPAECGFGTGITFIAVISVSEDKKNDSM